MMKCVAWLVLLAAPFVLDRSAAADPRNFGPDLSRSGWVVVSFPRIPPASFVPIDSSTLEVSTDASAGLLWRPIDGPLRRARVASWRWTVTEGVPPTDLTQRNLDDRALGVYFVFGTATDATKTPLALLGICGAVAQQKPRQQQGDAEPKTSSGAAKQSGYGGAPPGRKRRSISSPPSCTASTSKRSNRQHRSLSVEPFTVWSGWVSLGSSLVWRSRGHTTPPPDARVERADEV